MRFDDEIFGKLIQVCDVTDLIRTDPSYIGVHLFDRDECTILNFSCEAFFVPIGIFSVA